MRRDEDCIGRKAMGIEEQAKKMRGRPHRRYLESLIAGLSQKSPVRKCIIEWHGDECHCTSTAYKGGI